MSVGELVCECVSWCGSVGELVCECVSWCVSVGELMCECVSWCVSVGELMCEWEGVFNFNTLKKKYSHLCCRQHQMQQRGIQWA